MPKSVDIFYLLIILGKILQPSSYTMGTGSFPGVKAAGVWCWPHTPF